MTKMTYGEQLKHPNWQRRRLERLNYAGWGCERCQATETTLHVHHVEWHGVEMSLSSALAAFLAGYACAHIGGEIDDGLRDEAKAANRGWFETGVMVAALGYASWYDIADLIKAAHSEDRIPMEEAVRELLDHYRRPEAPA